MASYEKNTIVNEKPKITKNRRGKFQAEIQVYARTSGYQITPLGRTANLGDTEYTVKLIPSSRDYTLQTIVVELDGHDSYDYINLIEIDFNDDTSPAFRTFGPKKKTKPVLHDHIDPGRPVAPENNSVTKVEKTIGHQGLVEVRIEVYAHPSAPEGVKVFTNTESDGSKTYSLHLQPNPSLGYARLQTYLVPTVWNSMSEYSDISVIFNEV